MDLSKRQTEILVRVKSGQPDKVIAHELGISIHTVRTHIERIAEKIPGDIPRRYRLFFLNVDDAA
jgi:DNA-binding CsgD family transcriptional regulator